MSCGLALARALPDRLWRARSCGRRKADPPDRMRRKKRPPSPSTLPGHSQEYPGPSLIKPFRVPDTVKGVLVRHAMTADVISVTEDAPLLEASRLMRRHYISGLPVVDQNQRVIGVLSEKDVARALDERSPRDLIELVLDPPGVTEARLQRMRDRLETARVSEHMTREPFTIAPDAPVEAAAQIMKERKVNRLPVVERGRLVGIITRNDVIGVL